MKSEHSVAVATRAAVSDTGGVSDALETLVRCYHDKLVRFLFARLKSDQDAADLAQETYVRLLRYEGERSNEDLRHTLFRIARNLVTDHWRWKRYRGADTHVPIDELDIDVESGRPDLERQIAGEQQVQRLEQVIFAMPERRRTIFLLSRRDGLSYPQIARLCGISAKTVEKHIAMAIEECRAQVGDDDLQSL